MQALRKRIDLVVMPSIGKCQELAFKIIKPGRVRGKVDGASLDRCGLSGHAQDLVAVSIDADGVDILAVEVLNESSQILCFR